MTTQTDTSTTTDTATTSQSTPSPTQTTTDQTLSASNLPLRTDVKPSRGRFQLKDISGISAPYADALSRVFVDTLYSDGSKRTYTLAVVLKKTAILTQLLGAEKMAAVVHSV